MSPFWVSYRSVTSRFSPFAFVEMFSPYNKKNIARWLEDMNIFMFSWQEQYLTRSLRSLVRYCSCHENIKFISSHHRVISSISVHTCLSTGTCHYTNSVFIGASLLVACRWYICCMIQVWQAPDKVEISTLTLDLALNNKHIVLPSFSVI